jgi:V/A-type H+-transporting ATPase subunit C
MYARLLSKDDYDTLLSMKSVSQIAVYLKRQTPYAYVMRNIDESDVHRGQLEQVFKKSLFYDYDRLIKFTTGSYKSALRAMFESFEIDDLKLVISSICSANEHYLASEDLTYIRSYSAFSAESLLDARTMEELVDVVRDTRYYKALLPYATRSAIQGAARPDFMNIDHALDLLNYEAKMSEIKKTLSGAELKAVMSLYGAQADIGNILFIYRLKKLYGFTANEILVYLIPCRNRLSNKDLLEMAECAGIDELTDRIAETDYGFLFPKNREGDWENLHTEHFYKLHKKNIRPKGGAVGAFTTALSYLHLKEADIRNIIMIIEGVRYSLPTDRIASFLTR